ncbi:hypothetical protein BDV38DRAFT_278410 [Aspergillus pseudotamarii]|uniref:DUF7587 domain-containing protein n=1 Tax=Aspergillus pseudotamarii TaxID=132259 RepID=A0A5N6T7K6_ASPPS|nr:uncharacterized protein BDV38DRAFT_278410 [Aspergillus pseudotamarii]KAE8142240.1 hypothetical protein BDV38DRAFT_278410 [Aspergillus pseudotamarii]
MAQASILTQNIPLEYFPAPTEEEIHPWSQTSRVVLSQPLLRTWDAHSAVQPTSTNSMYSSCPCQLLDTFEARALSLAIHAHDSNQTPTPYISFTICAEEAQRLAQTRARTRGSQMLTVINPRVLEAHGRYLLSMVNEMHYYGVRDPHGMFYQDYQDEYLCLWVVEEEEVVGHWKWDELVEVDDWYEAIILPAFRDHDERFTARLSGIGSDISPHTSASAELISREQTSRWDADNPLDLDYPSYQHQYSSGEGYNESFEDHSDLNDSYYEAEANSIGYLLNLSENY